jgi:hypothetical protein
VSLCGGKSASLLGGGGNQPMSLWKKYERKEKGQKIKKWKKDER